MAVRHASVIRLFFSQMAPYIFVYDIASRVQTPELNDGSFHIKCRVNRTVALAFPGHIIRPVDQLHSQRHKRFSLRSKTPSPPSLSVRSPSRALYHTLHDISRLWEAPSQSFHVLRTFNTFSSPPFIMASYLRSLFSSGQPTPSHGKAKSRSRTHSTPAPSPYYVYTSAPGNTPSTSTTSGTSLSKVQRANSNKTPVMVSSPLRYPTYDSRHSHEDSRPPNWAANHQPPPDTMNGPYHPYP
jgi:hypothetical protein